MRAAAARALGPFAPDQRLVAAGHLLNDSVRVVRIEAARTLATVPPHLMSAQQRAAFDRAAKEFVDAEMAVAERPESHLNLGTFHADRARFSEAEAAYRTALHLDRSFVPAYVNLADLMRLQGGESKAEAILRDAIARVPDSAVAYHALGLTLIRQEHRQVAIEAFGEAAALDPDNPRYSYVFGVALNSIGESERGIRDRPVARAIVGCARSVIRETSKPSARPGAPIRNAVPVSALARTIAPRPSGPAKERS